MQGVEGKKLKVLLLAIGFCLLAAVIVVASGSGGNSSSQRRLVVPREPDAAQRTYALLTEIPQHGTALGAPSAPVTLQFFGDLQCEESRQVMLGALPFLIRRWVRAGELRIQYRSMQTDTHDWIEFREQQAAALAAGRQGKMWNFIDVFYRQQGPEFTEYADEDFIKEIAAQTGLDLRRWEEDWEPLGLMPQLEADDAAASNGKLNSTPSFLIGPTGGPARRLRHFSLEEPTVFDEAVEALLKA